MKNIFLQKKLADKMVWNSAPYNNKVRMWVDYCTLPDGNYGAATISSPIKVSGNATVATVSGNTRGFFYNVH